jgi:hypothetical protein
MAKHKVHPNKLPEIVVARRTHGAAFNPPPEGYEALMQATRDEVNVDFRELRLADFIQKYDMYLYDITV